jgi:hypothetical protein
MVKTGETNTETTSATDWDSLTKAPEVTETTEEPVKDAEYYRSNRSAIPELSSRLVELRGGVDGVKKGQFSKELRMMVDENGIPVFWSDLTRFLRKNPAEIDRVLALCEQLESGSEGGSESGSEETTEDVVSSEGVAQETGQATEAAESNDLSATVSTEEREQTSDDRGAEWRSGTFYINGYENMTTDERMDALDAGFDGITTFPEQTSHASALERIIGDTDGETQAAVKAMRAEDMVKFETQWIETYKKQLEALMPIYPWSSREKKDRVETIKGTIARTKKSLEYHQKEAELLGALAPEKPSSATRRFLDRLRAFNERSRVVNEALHIRNLPKYIRMREDWIKYDRAYVEQDMASGGKEKGSYAAREEKRNMWQQEISEYQGLIDDFMRRYPNFILTPEKGKKGTLFARTETPVAAPVEEQKAA